MVRTPGATERKRFKQYAHTYLHGAFQQSAHFIRARNHFFSYSFKIRPWLFFFGLLQSASRPIPRPTLQRVSIMHANYIRRMLQF